MSWFGPANQDASLGHGQATLALFNCAPGGGLTEQQEPTDEMMIANLYRAIYRCLIESKGHQIGLLPIDRSYINAGSNINIIDFSVISANFGHSLSNSPIEIHFAKFCHHGGARLGLLDYPIIQGR